MNLGQEKLAAKTGTTQRIISQIENADNYNMGAKMLFKLFKFLKIQMLIDGYDAITGQKINLEDIQILSNNDMAVSQQNFTIANEGFRYYINYHTYTNTSK
jgi:transcriptional regulator with XRE-family HTH domain